MDMKMKPPSTSIDRSITKGRSSTMEGSDSKPIRKYLVLLQDCLAIKFVPVPSPTATSALLSSSVKKGQPVCFKKSTSSSKSLVSSTVVAPSFKRSSCPQSRDEELSNANNEMKPVKNSTLVSGGVEGIIQDGDLANANEARDRNGFSASGHSQQGAANDNYFNNAERKQKPVQRIRTECHEDKKRIGHWGSTDGSLKQMDLSIKGWFLYKEFVDLNLSCFWNAALNETFKTLEYKGTVVPSTILVGSPIRRHLIVLKTAWSRKMLRCPQGYRIEFLGEIEELIADPVESSHFIPLSDSLCWAIQQLTSKGEKAFVDEILVELGSTFADERVVLPSKELIYQVLERLTRDKKVYQTCQGYFVVTPDTQRYIHSTQPTLFWDDNNDSKDHFSKDEFPPLKLISKSQLESEVVIDPLADVDADDGDDDDKLYEEKLNKIDELSSTFKRCSSLRNSMKRGTKVSGCLSRKTYSFREDKSATMDSRMISHSSSTMSLDIYGIDNPASFRRQKHKSFLKKFLTFRRSSRKEPIPKPIHDEKLKKKPNVKPLKTSKSKSIPPKSLTISTQTSMSIENLQTTLGLLAIVPPPLTQNGGTASANPEIRFDMSKEDNSHDDSDSGRYTESSSPQSERGSGILNSNRMRQPTKSQNYSAAPKAFSTPSQVEQPVDNDTGFGHINSVTARGTSSLSLPSSSPSTSCYGSSSSPSPTYTNSSNDTKGSLGDDSCSNFNYNSSNSNSLSRSESPAGSSMTSYRDLYNTYRRRQPQGGSYHKNSATGYRNSSSHSTPSPSYSNSKPNSQYLSTKPPPVPLKYPAGPSDRKHIYGEMKNKNDQKYEKVSSLRQKAFHTSHSHTHKSHTRETLPSSIQTFNFNQTLKNETNLELELLFPIGKLLSAALTDFEQKSDPKKPPQNWQKSGTSLTESEKEAGETTNCRTTKGDCNNGFGNNHGHNNDVNNQDQVQEPRKDPSSSIFATVSTTSNFNSVSNCTSSISNSNNNKGPTSIECITRNETTTPLSSSVGVQNYYHSSNNNNEITLDDTENNSINNNAPSPTLFSNNIQLNFDCSTNKQGNNNETERVINSDVGYNRSSRTTNGSSSSNPDGRNSVENVATVNDLFTINCKSFITKNNSNNADQFNNNVQVQFKASPLPTTLTSLNGNGSLCSSSHWKLNNSSNKNKCYTPEPVSFIRRFNGNDSFTHVNDQPQNHSILTRLTNGECRESEII